LTALSLWVVFDHPRDFPAHIVVREQLVGRAPGTIEHAPVACLYASLEEMRADFYGGTWLERQPGDDPCIVGVWV